MLKSRKRCTFSGSPPDVWSFAVEEGHELKYSTAAYNAQPRLNRVKANPSEGWRREFGLCEKARARTFAIMLCTGVSPVGHEDEAGETPIRLARGESVKPIVIWSPLTAMVFEGLQVDPTTANRVYPVAEERGEAIKRLWKWWDSYEHWGDVPQSRPIGSMHMHSQDGGVFPASPAAADRSPVADLFRHVAEAHGVAAASPTKSRQPTCPVKLWLTDTGCGHDLICRDETR